MAVAILYALPPMTIYDTFRRKMSSGLTMGGVKARIRGAGALRLNSC
jgi:ABC-type maltose transport system permease subunit